MGGTLYFGVRNGSTGNIYTTTAIPNDANWHNYVATFNSGTTKIYIDGSEVSGTQTGTNPSTISSTLGSFFIGRNGADNKYTDGLLDEASVFNTALSASDITSIYNNGVPGDISSLNPLGWWRMGDDSNDSATAGGSVATITDSSGNGNDATQSTASNQPTFKALEQAPTSVSFDGSNDYLDLSSLDSTISSIGTGAVTISMWVKFDNSIPAYSGFLHFGNADAFSDYFYCRYNNGSVEFQSREGASGVSNVLASVSKNVWHHLVFIRSGTTGTLYVNNSSTSVTNAEFGADFSNNTNNFMRVGSNRTNTQAGMVLVDEVAVFNSALSASDVASLASSRGAHIVNDLSLSPTGYWRMGEDDSLTDGASVSQITDASGNGLHATQSTAANQPTASVDPVIYV